MFLRCDPYLRTIRRVLEAQDGVGASPIRIYLPVTSIRRRSPTDRPPKAFHLLHREHDRAPLTASLHIWGHGAAAWKPCATTSELAEITRKGKISLLIRRSSQTRERKTDTDC